MIVLLLPLLFLFLLVLLLLLLLLVLLLLPRTTTTATLPRQRHITADGRAGCGSRHHHSKATTTASVLDEKVAPHALSSCGPWPSWFSSYAAVAVTQGHAIISSPTSGDSLEACPRGSPTVSTRDHPGDPPGSRIPQGLGIPRDICQGGHTQVKHR